MKIRAWDLIVASALGCAAAMMAGTGVARGASAPPLSSSWNIRSAGSAESSGELLFRVTPGNPDDDPIEVTVSVMAGANEGAIARKIQSTLATQLRADRFNVTLGQGANVLVTDQRGRPSFALELVTSDIENVRVAVQSTQPTVTPTVPAQTVPATTPTPATPPGPGNALPPTGAPPASSTSPTSPGTNPPPAPSESTPASAPPGATPAMPNPAPPPDATGGSGQPATAPPGPAAQPLG